MVNSICTVVYLFAVLEKEYKNSGSGFLRIGNEVKTFCKIIVFYLRITNDIVRYGFGKVVTYCG